MTVAGPGIRIARALLLIGAPVMLAACQSGGTEEADSGLPPSLPPGMPPPAAAGGVDDPARVFFVTEFVLKDVLRVRD